MTLRVNSLLDIASQFDAIVLDQWGVLHDGTRPYPRAVSSLLELQAAGIPLSVLSNSGKRAAPNAARISTMGFPEGMFAHVMTSGEALWRDVRNGRVIETSFYPIERTPGDAEHWAKGLEITLTDRPETAEAVLLMGLPDGSDGAEFQPALDLALATKKPVYCSNPDRASPRSGGLKVISPGSLAYAHAARSGKVVYYGKPYRPIFDALEEALGTKRVLIVGDSLEHDIAGGYAANWKTALIQNGLYAEDFADQDQEATLAKLMKQKSAPAPDFRLDWLQ